MMPHCPIPNTALAAALATLGVPFDKDVPYSWQIDTESGQECMNFLFRDASKTDPTRRTEEIVAAWDHRVRFEKDFPLHPLVPMRAAHDARTWLVKIINGRELPPLPDFKGERHLTPLLPEAALLKAMGFPLLALTNRSFAFPMASPRGLFARQVVEQSQKAEGSTSPQWMARFLFNFGMLLAFVKDSVPRLITREDNRTLDLSAEAPKKLRDQFHELF